MQLSEFGNILLKQNVRPAKGTFSIKQAQEGKIIEVRKLDPSPYKPLYCWYNCKAHSIKHGGEIVFGWSLNFANDMYQAQHHAVWLSGEGEYIDVTPDKCNSDTILLIDGRAPFCFETFKHPANLYYEPDEKLLGWGDIDRSEMYPDYYIGVPESKNDPCIKWLLGKNT